MLQRLPSDLDGDSAEGGDGFIWPGLAKYCQLALPTGSAFSAILTTDSRFAPEGSSVSFPSLAHDPFPQMFNCGMMDPEVAL